MGCFESDWKCCLLKVWVQDSYSTHTPRAPAQSCARGYIHHWPQPQGSQRAQPEEATDLGQSPQRGGGRGRGPTGWCHAQESMGNVQRNKETYGWWWGHAPWLTGVDRLESVCRFLDLSHLLNHAGSPQDKCVHKCTHMHIDTHKCLALCTDRCLFCKCGHLESVHKCTNNMRRCTWPHCLGYRHVGWTAILYAHRHAYTYRLYTIFSAIVWRG